MSTIKYYWENMQIGSTRELGPVRPTADHIHALAVQFDPQPFHTDQPSAPQPTAGGLGARRPVPCRLRPRGT